ncbi:MAG: hypothetical protein ABSC08_19775, partial [Bryobacteraceae bacterium]
MNTVAIDPEFAAVIPPMGQEEFNLLEANICAEGCRDPLVKWRGILLDGHNRLKICERHDIPFRTVEREFADRQAAKDWILANQLARRNLHGDQFTVLLGQLYNSRKKAAGGRSDREFGVCEVTAPKTSEVLAKAHGVSEATVRRAGKKAEELEAIAKEDPTAAKAIMAGKMKLTEVAKNLRRRAVAEQIRREPAPLPEGPFRVI